KIVGVRAERQGDGGVWHGERDEVSVRGGEPATTGTGGGRDVAIVGNGQGGEGAEAAGAQLADSESVGEAGQNRDAAGLLPVKESSGAGRTQEHSIGSAQIIERQRRCARRPQLDDARGLIIGGEAQSKILTR